MNFDKILEQFETESSKAKKVAIDEGCRDDISEEIVGRVILKEMKTVKEQIDGCPDSREDLKAEYQARYDIISEFAPQMMSAEEVENYIKEQEVLIVDVRNWKNKWYSIYTLWLGGYITDTVDRSSFLAISIVVPNQYFCLVSAVYDTLKNAYLNSIVGTYISSKGEYIVQNFNNDSAFERLLNTINSNFVNLSENFDNNFKQDNNEAITNCCYNLLDCDSKAFVEDWREYHLGKNAG